MTDSQKLDLILDKVVSLDNRVSSLDNKVVSLSDRVVSLEESMASLDSKVVSLSDRVASLEENMDSLKLEVTKINLMLENETNRNIKIIAEGHLDLTRKLDEAINGSCEVKAKLEIHEIYINKHERMLNAL